MRLLFVLFLGAQAITYDEMKEYNCYTPRERENSRDLRCGLAIQENEKCEEMCRTADTVARRDNNPGNIYQRLVISGTQLCEITFSGRCASKTFSRNENDLCFTINTRALGYNQAVQDCEDNGGNLYVPNSDYDLRRLINLTDSKISKFWFGGGSIFFRTCRDPSMGKSEEVAVQYIITENDREFLGYTTTRLTSDKAPYVCTMPSSKKSQACLSFNKPTTTITQPQCSFKLANVGTPAAAMWLAEACFPDGPLQVGDSIIIQGVQPPCCPPGIDSPNFSLWSINLLSYNKSPLLHLTLKRSWQKIGFTSATEGWGKFVQGESYPCPFLPNTQFKIEITNTFNHLAFTINTRSYTYPHAAPKGQSPVNLYHSIGLAISRQFKVWSVVVVRNGVQKKIGLGVVDFEANPA